MLLKSQVLLISTEIWYEFMALAICKMIVVKQNPFCYFFYNKYTNNQNNTNLNVTEIFHINIKILIF